MSRASLRAAAAALIVGGVVVPTGSDAQTTHHLTADTTHSGSQIVTMRSRFRIDATNVTTRTAGHYIVAEVAEVNGKHRFVYAVVPRFRTGYRTIFNTPAQNDPHVPTARYVSGGDTFPAGKYRVTVVVDSPSQLSIPFTGDARDVTLTLSSPAPPTVTTSYGAVGAVTDASPGIYRHTVHVATNTLVFVAGYIGSGTYQFLTVPPEAIEAVNACAQQSPALTPCRDSSTAVVRAEAMWFQDYSEWTAQLYPPGALTPGAWDAEVDSLGTAALGPLYPSVLGPANVFGIPFACVITVNL